MAEATDILSIIYQNLQDAGCDAHTTEQCMSLVKKGNYRGLLPLLLAHRNALRGELRRSQKQIDCLDYLIYQINKNMTAKKG